jgi:hypothetical protein
MKLSTTVVMLCLALTSCAADMQVKRLQDFTPRSKTFVFISESRWNALFREALQDHGLKVLRFASRDTVVSKGNDSEVARISQNAEAQYGLEITRWHQVAGTNNCINSSDDMMVDVSVEVTDLVTNEVLLEIKDGGVTTRHCGVVWESQTVFEKIASTLAAQWK